MCCNCNAVTSCCFGSATLKTGVLATSIYSAVVGLLYLILYIVQITVVENILKDNEGLLAYFRTVYIVYAVVYGAWILFTIGLFMGWKVGNRCLMMCWLIYTWILTVLLILGALINIMKIGAIFAAPFSAALYILTIIVIIVNIYCCLVVNSYYYSLAPPATQTTIVTTYPGNVQVVQTGYAPVPQQGEPPAQYVMGNMPPHQGNSGAPPDYREKQQV